LPVWWTTFSSRLEFGNRKQTYYGLDSYITPALEALKKIDWNVKTREISRFLFESSESDRVLRFREYATEERIREWLSIDDHSP